MKNAYLLWDSYYQILPKRHRYSLGLRTDDLFVEIIEMTAVASYSANSEKQPYVRLAIRKLDTLKILLMILWEAGSLQDNQYIALSLKLDEIGKNLGGWNGQIIRQNSPGKPGEKR